MTKDELKTFRKSKQMTQAAFATAIGKTRKTVVNWETGVYSVPADVMDLFTAKGLLEKGVPKAPTKADLQREAAISKNVDFWVRSYRSLRSWPDIRNHMDAMRVYAGQGHDIPCEAYAAIVAEFPDILSDPDGNHAMTKEQSLAVRTSLELQQSKG